MQTVDGRDAITRKEWAEQIGYSVAGARLLYDQRAQNGHPASAFPIGRTLYWWKDELDAWWKKHQEATRPAPIERVGEPGELLFAQGAADVLGYADGRTVLTMAARGQFPSPDHIVPGEGQKSGQPRPQWKRSTVWGWADNRGWVRNAQVATPPTAVDNPRQPG